MTIWTLLVCSTLAFIAGFNFGKVAGFIERGRAEKEKP